ncbi:type I restriction enzyme R subunit [Bradymonas sediminis]|nr:HsdR family type I site-specific deoxyribonuclease [Bradymonas sediminis]TDP77707.1 type I restriction enzyme R subunit [Bradymonas sediminis]
MSVDMSEDAVENTALEEFRQLGWQVIHGGDIAPGEPGAERADYTEVVLRGRLEDAVRRLNPGVPAEAREEAIRRVLYPESPSLIENNRRFHRMLTDGVAVEVRRADGVLSGEQVRLIDFGQAEQNDWTVVNQFSVTEGQKTRRPDIIVFVNGLPLGVFELKKQGGDSATILKAYQQLENYKDAIPALFAYNEVNVISDHQWARIGSLTAPIERFMPWRTTDGSDEIGLDVLQLGPLIQGVFEKSRFLDLLQHFVVFQDTKKGAAKILAAYHQFHAARTAVEATVSATRQNGDRKAGVVWHTQGSGKSFTMTFYAGRVIQHPAMENPTLIIITDRNDLDDQLFTTFAQSNELLRQKPVQAESRDHIKELLKRASGGVIFTTIQKFFPEEKHARHPLLTARKNVVVIADEAHRSQYGFVEGFARHMRDAVPNASFIGFTGTPIDLEDRSTRTVFGDYISIYDIEQAIEDGATVPIYYENRLVKLKIDEAIRDEIDREFDKLTADSDEAFQEELKSKYSTLEKLVAHPKRIDQIAGDMLAHFDKRLEALEGKAMVVCISREACVKLYEAITRLRPEWHSERDEQGQIKVVMTGSSSDPKNFQDHIRSKSGRDLLAQRFKDPADPLKMVLVCNMWLTGFDAPCAHTIYIDKPLRGHNLMQAVARVNRVFHDKPGGLVVDYIGITKSLKKAIKTYTESGGKGKPQLDVQDAVDVMLEQVDICRGMLHGFDYSAWFDRSAADAGTNRLAQLVLDGANFVRDLEDGRQRFMRAVSGLSKAYSLAGAHEEAERLHDEVALFQHIRGVLAKTDPDTAIRQQKVDHAVKQLVSAAIASDEVVDVLSMAGLERSDISILSTDFLSEVAGMKQKNLAIDMLRKLLNEEIKGRAKSNLVQSRKFSEMLQNAVQRYQNRSIETVQVIEELLGIARQMREVVEREQTLDMSPEEIAFYSALIENDSAVEVLGDDTLREMASQLTDIVRRTVSVDWTRKESARAKLRTLVKRFLKRYGYPPDMQKMAMDTIVKQAEYFGDDWVTQAAESPPAEPAPYPFDILDPADARPYENCVPLLNLKAAAGAFSEAQTVAEFSNRYLFSDEAQWATLPDYLKAMPGFFVAQVIGESMNRRIPNGAYCLFRAHPGGTRNGKVVLAQHRDLYDDAAGAGYTIKLYRSEKQPHADGTLRHTRIWLEPDSTDARFEPIEIEQDTAEEFRILAELVAVLG